MWLYSLIEEYDENIEFFKPQILFFIEKNTLIQIVNTEEE
jgi:hypothetical protein